MKLWLTACELPQETQQKTFFQVLNEKGQNFQKERVLTNEINAERGLGGFGEVGVLWATG